MLTASLVLVAVSHGEFFYTTAVIHPIGQHISSLTEIRDLPAVPSAS